MNGMIGKFVCNISSPPQPWTPRDIWPDSLDCLPHMHACMPAGMTNLLLGTDLTPQQLEYVEIAQHSGNALM